MGIYIAIDYGKKRIGMAHCDAGEQFVFGMPTVANQGGRKAIAKTIMDVLVAKKAEALVLGLPRNMDGSEGPRAQASRAYARNCVEAFALPLMLWDERWSTQAAEAAMIGQDMSRARRAAAIDSHAAAVILQGAIDRLAGGVL